MIHKPLAGLVRPVRKNYSSGVLFQNEIQNFFAVRMGSQIKLVYFCVYVSDEKQITKSKLFAVWSAEKLVGGSVNVRISHKKYRIGAVINHCGGGNFKRQFKRADKVGAKVAVVLGEAEIASGTLGVKDLRNEGSQQEYDFAGAVAAISKMLQA